MAFAFAPGILGNHFGTAVIYMDPRYGNEPMPINKYIKNRTKSKYPILPAICLLGTVFFGCSGPEFGEIRVPTAQQYTLAEGKTDVPLTLPVDQAFAIHLKKSSQNPGAEGRAQGDSAAAPTGQSFCLAEGANGGTATAEFNIGHRIDNPGPAESAQIQVNFSLKQSLSATKQPTTETIASANLLLVVLDARRKVLAKIPILQTSSDQAAGEGVVDEQRGLTVTLEAKQSYDVILFGQVQANSSAKQEARARIELEKLTMQFRFSPATTQPAAK
jgi:hypothetical protein